MSRTEKAQLILRTLERDQTGADAESAPPSGADRRTLAAALSELVRDMDQNKKRKAKSDSPSQPDHAFSPRDGQQVSRASKSIADRPIIPVANDGALPDMPDLGIEHPLTAAQIIGRLPTPNATAILRQLPPVLAQQIVLALGQDPADNHTPTALTEHATHIIRSMT